MIREVLRSEEDNDQSKSQKRCARSLEDYNYVTRCVFLRPTSTRILFRQARRCLRSKGERKLKRARHRAGKRRRAERALYRAAVDGASR
jgi:hypothetical protein